MRLGPVRCNSKARRRTEKMYGQPQGKGEASVQHRRGLGRTGSTDESASQGPQRRSCQGAEAQPKAIHESTSEDVLEQRQWRAGFVAKEAKGAAKGIARMPF